MGPGIPELKQRAGTGDHQKRETDGDEQQGDDVPRRVGRVDRFPAVVGRDRQQREGQAQESDVDERLSPRVEPGPDQVGIQIPSHQQQLKEEHAGGPDGGAPAIPRQDVAGDDWLDLEQQERPEKDRDRVQCHPT